MHEREVNVDGMTTGGAMEQTGSTRHESDVLIVGGGASGLAAALALGRQGHRVRVVDKAPLPRDKVCGEGLMPMALAALAALGIAADALPGAGFRGLAYRSRERSALLDFPAGVEGRGVRRTALITALHAATARVPGITHHADAVRGLLREHGESGRIVGVRGQQAGYHAPIVLAADGVQSGCARLAGTAPTPYGERMGLRRHYRLPAGLALPRVGVGLLAPHDIYLTPVGADTLLATTMTDRASYRAIAGDYTGFLRRGPYADLFAAAEPVSQQLGWHHPLFAPPRYAVAGMLLVGDAGGGVDPCLGVGISMALASAQAATRAAAGILAEPARRADWERRFEDERRSLFRHFNAFGRVFRFLVRSGRGSEALVAAMGHWPGVADCLLDIVATGRPWRTFHWPALLQPLLPARANGGRGRGTDED